MPVHTRVDMHGLSSGLMAWYQSIEHTRKLRPRAHPPLYHTSVETKPAPWGFGTNRKRPHGRERNSPW